MKPIVIDFETICNGKSDFRFWRDGFSILSVAASWRNDQGEIKSWFSKHPGEIDNFLRRLSSCQTPLIAHNFAYEMGVLMKLYPLLEFNWAADTLRMGQMLDNGGDWADYIYRTDEDIVDEYLGGASSKIRMGLSLEAMASRFLSAEFHGHKNMAHEWLEKHEKIKSNHGGYLHLLPEDILKAYNVSDTETTLLLYEELSKEVANKGVDLSQDWVLYKNRTKLMQASYISGILVNRELLKSSIYELQREIDDITKEFNIKAAPYIEIWSKNTNRPVSDFNIGSNKHLKELFVGVLNLTINKTTKKGEKLIQEGNDSKEDIYKTYPSFASKHLPLWGDLGKILLARRKKLLVFKQEISAYVMSDEDGRVHPEIRVSGTRTNRVSGGEFI